MRFPSVLVLCAQAHSLLCVPPIAAAVGRARNALGELRDDLAWRCEARRTRGSEDDGPGRHEHDIMSTVLTVDDSKVVRSMVTRHPRPYDCTIVEVTNGREAVDMARTHQIDLVLLAGTMPVMDGRQEVSEILGPPGVATIANATLDAGTVLVVDDSDEVLAMAKTALEPSMTLLTATSGRAAIAATRDALCAWTRDAARQCLQ
jgi:CheY-like chemotaxis protein